MSKIKVFFTKYTILLISIVCLIILYFIFLKPYDFKKEAIKSTMSFQKYLYKIGIIFKIKLKDNSYDYFLISPSNNIICLRRMIFVKIEKKKLSPNIIISIIDTFSPEKRFNINTAKKNMKYISDLFINYYKKNKLYNNNKLYVTMEFKKFNKTIIYYYNEDKFLSNRFIIISNGVFEEIKFND